MINTQPLEVKDFTLGITDYYIDGDPRAAKKMENLFINPNGKPFTRWGSVTINDQLPLGLFRVNKLTDVKDNLIAFQNTRAYRDNAGTWTEIQGPASGTFMPAGNTNSVITSTEWQDHVFFSSDILCSPQKLYIDGGGTYSVRNAGLPIFTSGISVTNPPGAGESYLYAFVISYTYTVGTVTYLDRSAPYYYGTTVTGGAITAGNTTTSTIPGTLTPVENWDQANWKVEIYRTTTSGTVYYKVGQVNFGVTSFVDNVPDATLESNEQLYTTGGVAANDVAPKAKYVHCLNDYGYWAHIQEGSEILSTEVRQSKAGDPDSVPTTFYATTEQPITGLFSIYDRPLVLCEHYIYRIDNFYADDGTGGMLLRRIDDKAGCVSSASLVQTHLGAFWAGNQGFYWSDGFRVECISNQLNETYKNLVRNSTTRKNIVGTFDPSSQRVFWTVSTDAGSNEPDTIFVLDLKYVNLNDAAKKGGTFTTMVGVGLVPSALHVLGNYIYRGSTQGFIFKHGVEYLTDPKVNVATLPSTWGTQAILHTYESCFLDFGSKFYRKFVPRILVSASNTTNLSLGISSSNDNNRVQGDLKPINYKSNITWGDTLPVWGDPYALWNYQGLIEEWRRFPAGGLRCNYKQVIFYNATVNIINSDLLGTATIDDALKTATLGGSFTWLPDCVDYYVKFEHDNYSREFKITSRTPTTIVYEDTGNAGPINGVYKWQMVGQPKGEILLLNGYVIHWAYISKSHTPFSSSSLGSNPA
jgi:hypothetical protein